MYFLLFIGLALAALLLLVLDGTRKIRLTHPLPMLVILPCLVNFPAAVVLYNMLVAPRGSFWLGMAGVVLFLFGLYCAARLHLFPTWTVKKPAQG